MDNLQICSMPFGGEQAIKPEELAVMVAVTGAEKCKISIQHGGGLRVDLCRKKSAYINESRFLGE